MDLTTTYLGLRLKNPLVASASPLTRDIDSIRRLEDAGAAAVVLPSIFEEQIRHEMEETERLVEKGSDSNPEAMSYFAPAAHHPGPQTYLDRVHQARRAVDIPVIASLNGITDSGWLEYARLFQQAGASALELNMFFVPSDLSIDGVAVERRHVDILRAVKREVTIPVAVKLAPYFSALGDMVHRLEEVGADGCVLFNRFYQPDIDLASLSLRRGLELSTRAEIRLPLLWIGACRRRHRDDHVSVAAVRHWPYAQPGERAEGLARRTRHCHNRGYPWSVKPLPCRRPYRVRPCQLHQHSAGLVERRAAVTWVRGVSAPETRVAGLSKLVLDVLLCRTSY
jgi:dihydroorotate dehydrogenase (fumarate)